MQTQLAGRRCSSTASAQHRHRAAARLQRSRALVAQVRASSANGNGKVQQAARPTPAETARTVADLSQEAVLCTLTEASTPLGTPVGYSLDKEGNPVIVVASNSPEAANIGRSSRCSLLVQPIAYPARGVASVALQGAAAAEADQSGAPEGTTLFKLEVDSCVYYGGLDQAAHGLEIDGATYRSAEPDLLRHAADELISTWNSERAEDIYRIVAAHMNLPVEEMLYAELLWIDRLGLYVRTEALGRSPAVVRVPFYRPVLDERDARSVLTMGSHITWDMEKQRSGMAYVPAPIPAAPAGSNN